MNKIYKLVWNRAKNCYVVACEFAKSCGKKPSVIKGMRMAKASLSVALMLSNMWVNSAYADVQYETHYADGSEGNHSWGLLTYQAVGHDANGTYISGWDYGDQDQGVKVYIANTSGSGGTSGLTGITAGNGITVTTSGTTATVTAKAGTGITVDSTGIHLTAGNVASGNANAITGGQAYTELRPTNGTYVKQANTTATNLKALDTQVKANTDALDDLSGDLNAKANADASNVASQAAKWGTAIGTGTVTASDGKLVTGKTVYEELRPADGSQPDRIGYTGQSQR